MKTKRKNKFIYLFGFLIMLFGVLLLSYDQVKNKSIETIEEKSIEQYIENENIISKEEDIETKEKQKEPEINYIGILEIPKINLKRGLVDKHDKLNNVNFNIQILNESSMPDEENGNVILAGHSGNARVSFFRNLYKLNNGDVVNINYKGNNYQYEIVSKYEIDKNGTARIIRNKEKNTITLITCKSKTNKQYVFIGELIKKI